MSKRLYPKPAPKSPERTQEDLTKRPFHVQYTDPSEQLKPEWRHYKTELGVKVGAWYNARFLGFRPEATLFDRDELTNG